MQLQGFERLTLGWLFSTQDATHHTSISGSEKNQKLKILHQTTCVVFFAPDDFEAGCATAGGAFLPVPLPRGFDMVAENTDQKLLNQSPMV